MHAKTDIALIVSRFVWYRFRVQFKAGIIRRVMSFPHSIERWWQLPHLTTCVMIGQFNGPSFTLSPVNSKVCFSWDFYPLFEPTNLKNISQIPFFQPALLVTKSRFFYASRLSHNSERKKLSPWLTVQTSNSVNKKHV